MLGGQAEIPVDKQKSTTPISQIGQAVYIQKLQHTCKDGEWIPYPLLCQIPHRWRMPVGLSHNEQR